MRLDDSKECGGMGRKGRCMSLLVKGGMVYQNGRFSTEDLLIENGIIREIGDGLGKQAGCGKRSE